MLKVILIVSTLIATIELPAQVVPLYSNHQHYDTEDGLPQNYVSGIVQDQDGFIWMSTQDGIARFDGHNFLEFNISSDSGQRISTPRVLDVKIDVNHKLWILHYNYTVDVMNPRTLEISQDVRPFKSVDFDSFAVPLSYREAFYFYFVDDIDSGHWFLKDQGKFHLYDSSNLKLVNLFSAKNDNEGQVFGFDVDDTGRLWLLGQGGLKVSDSSWSKFKHIAAPDSLDFRFYKYSLLSPIAQISQGRLFMIIDERWFIYDEPADEFRELQVPEGLSYNSPGHTINACRDTQGRVVFGYQGYVFRLNEDETVSLLWELPEKDEYLISSIFIDRGGTLWVGINTGGIYRINTLVPSFNSREYTYNFAVDLLKIEMGVDSTDIPFNWFQKKGSYDFRYRYSKDNKLYISLDGIYFGRNTRIFSIERGQMQEIESPQTNKYFRGFDDDGEILTAIDTEGMYYRWDNVFEPPSLVQVMDSSKIPSEGLVDYLRAKGQGWILSPDNMLYSLKDEVIVPHNVGNSNYSLIGLSKTIEPNNEMWISSYGGGLLKWNLVENRVEKNYTIENGLPDNTVAGMVPDKEGNLWISTFNGISRFDPSQERFTNFLVSDGLIQSEFDRHHAFRFPDGRIAFGGSEGYSIFDPANFKEDKTNPHTNITSLWVENNPIRAINGYAGISLNNLSALELDYDQNSLKVEIAAMQYANPEKNQYRYQLTGFNEKWINIGSSRTIRFDNLEPGSYELLLNASNTRNVWSSDITSLNISISPPWWLSWWAYTIYFILTCILVFAYWRTYRRRLIRKQEEEFNRREAKRLQEVDDMKTRFFSNITHEFRTPLTLILSPLQKELSKKQYPSDIQKILESNYRHGSHLLKLVNELLDVSKLESGFMQQHKSTGQLNTFGKDCIDQFEEWGKQKNISLIYETQGIDGFYQFDRSHWQKIITNLLSNAIKFTSSGGSVIMRLEELEDNGKHQIKIEVEDTGIGIAEADRSRLFERFFQADDSVTREQEGTGIGLSLVRELSELMKGTVSVNSELGKGSIFTVTLPVDKLEENKAPGSQNVLKSQNLDQSDKPAPLILVVEDNPELRSFIVESLHENWDVIEAKNGKEGREALLERLPEIVISDVMMPEMDGFELCRLSKKDPRTSHIHFILLTAKTAHESKVQGLEKGADDYLTKPFQFYELELRIQNALQKQEDLRSRLTSEIQTVDPKSSLQKVEDLFLSKAYSHIEQNLTNGKLSVDSLASEMALSQSTLNRKLKALLNISAVEFIKQYRLKRAVEILATGDSIANVAYKAGFESASYFSQCFKESYKMSPSEYQNSLPDGKP